MKSLSALFIGVSGLVVVVLSRVIPHRETQILFVVVGVVVALVGVVRWIYSIGGRSDEE